MATLAELTAQHTSLSQPSVDHLLRLTVSWSLLADLYERSGDIPRARELFERVVAADPELSDAAERLAGLR